MVPKEERQGQCRRGNGPVAKIPKQAGRARLCLLQSVAYVGAGAAREGPVLLWESIQGWEAYRALVRGVCEAHYMSFVELSRSSVVCVKSSGLVQTTWRAYIASVYCLLLRLILILRRDRTATKCQPQALAANAELFVHVKIWEAWIETSPGSEPFSER